LELYLDPTEPAVGEQVLDQIVQMLSRGGYPFRILLAGGVKTLSIILQQCLAKSLHGSQGRPEVMRDGIGESLQPGVCLLELLSAFLYQLFEFFGLLPYLLFGLLALCYIPRYV